MSKPAKEKETEKSSAKSSGSDKEKRPDARPSKSRGTSFGGLFGGPSPARTKPVRRTSENASKNASRRQSMDVDALGFPSPPPDDTVEMSTKAAKLMGTSYAKVSRKESTRGKQKASGIYHHRVSLKDPTMADSRRLAVPDAYPIDDDDMVMINTAEDPIIDTATFKNRERQRDKGTKSKTKKEVKTPSIASRVAIRPRKTLSKRHKIPELIDADGETQSEPVEPSPELVDDIVMVEAGPSNEAAEGLTGPDLAFEKPKPLQRSSTSAKKPGSKLMGLFGGFQKSRRMSESNERPRSKTLIDDEDAGFGRKRTVTGGDDGAKRIRRDDRRIRRSERPDVTIHGLIADPPVIDAEAAPAPEDAEARREARRAKRASKAGPSKVVREAELIDAEGRRSRRREAEEAEEETRRKTRDAEDRRVRKEEEQEAVRQEEKRAKKATKEERRAKEDAYPKDLGFDIPEKRSRRRDRELPEKEIPPGNHRHHALIEPSAGVRTWIILFPPRAIVPTAPAGPPRSDQATVNPPPP